jgi:predicted DNA-binding transcriptional regulator YafY
MARHEMTLRVFRILHYLETSRTGLRVGEIHQKLIDDDFDVTTRTVHRDLELLQAAHVPLESEGNGPESRWKMSPFAEIKKNVQFTYHEIFALYVARNSLDHLKGTPIFEALTSLFMKLEKVLGTNSEAFQELLQNVAFRPQMTWATAVPQMILDTVYHALDEGHVLKIAYRAEAGKHAGKYVERRVGPECLYFANGGVYLIAKDLEKNAPRTYALSRISEAEMLSSEAYDKEGLSPDKMFKESFGVLNTGDTMRIELLVDGPIAAYVSERRWHASQQILKTDKGVIVKMDVQINDELARWILSLGPAATVLSPAPLIELVGTLADQLAEKYKQLKKSA